MKRKTLPKIQFKLRPFQGNSVTLAKQLIESNPDEWHLFVSPTGTGKSVMELQLLADIPNSILITPRVEIIAGMLDKMGITCETWQDIVTKGSSYGLFTPIRLRNLLASGEMPFQASVLILDESHHSLAESWQDISMYLNGIPTIGFTASPFRGTPKGTEEFRKQWGTINYCITLAEAITKGYCAFPTSQLWPMVDDDTIELVNGEIKLSVANELIQSNQTGIVNRCKQFYDTSFRVWDRATMFSVPSTVVAKSLTAELNKVGLPAVCVTQETKRSERVEAFNDVVTCKRALVQIDVISEGVDLQIRRLIDIKPTMSPVRWLQQIGRIMRPSEVPPEYICLCRNLERHCYLMEGLVPNSTIKAAQEAFEDTGFSKRSGSRAVGLEGLGKFVITPIHLLSGITAFAYNLVHMEGFTKREVFILVHPGHPEPLRCTRTSTRTSEGDYDTGGNFKPPTYDWGKWGVTESIPDLKGCASAKPGTLTPRQEAYWLRSAEHVGLNPHKPVNNRSFQILPLLRDLGIKL